MLLCSINEIESGMVVAATVRHPSRPEMELVSPGLILDRDLIDRLKRFEVLKMWVDHDATHDLDKKLEVSASPARQAVFKQLQESFRHASASTISSADIAAYRQTVMDLVCELTSNRDLVPLAERLANSSGDLFAHCASVAYLSVLVALELETYVIKQRQTLNTDHARDLAALGIGAMLHDIGKLAGEDKSANELSVLDAEELIEQQPGLEPDGVKAKVLAACARAYRGHTLLGYRMLEHARAPASARQIVLGHHQRWDGSGFPDMGEVTGNRIKGTQAEGKIHIFSRIVGAANVLERLLRDASGTQRPVIAALHAFGSDRFDGWFDPVVRDTVLRKIPPFSVGSQVRLSDGRAAVVLEPNPVQPCMPTVRILEDDVDRAEVIELNQNQGLTIVSCAGEDVEPYLFFLKEEQPLAARLVFT